MKKSILFALLFVLFIPSLVSAQSDEDITKRRPDTPTVPQIQEIRQEIGTNFLENHASRLERRFKFYYDRLSNIILRFQTRLDYLNNQGKSITAAQTKLNAAKAKLEEAKLKGSAAVTAFRALDPSKLLEEKTQILAARDLALAARKLFVDALDLLKIALKELKTISKPALPAASPAVQNSLY